jgi:hypothetical protein
MYFISLRLSPMCRITITPTWHNHKKSSQDEPTDHSCAMPADPKPMQASEPHTSSLPSGIYINHTSTTLSSSPHGNYVAKGFVDHYAILNLDCWATSEEIKASYRALRAQYFTTDPIKYRALQAAFDALVDRQARIAYDKVYRMRLGLPAPVDALPLSIIAIEGSCDVVSDGKSLPLHVETTRDPNKALRAFCWGRYRSVIGSVPYQSWIPMRIGYKGRKRHERLLCRRPKYILVLAKNARSG